MALKACLGCARQVDTTAAACPGCGRPKPTATPTPRWAYVAGLVVSLGMMWKCISGIAGDDAAFERARAGSEPRAAVAVESAPQKEDPIPVKATRLHRDYDANEVAADEKYKGKLLLVEGVISSIDKDFMGDTVLMLSSGQMLSDVHAELTKAEAPRAAQLKKRQRVEVECRGAGRVLTSAVLKGCVVTATWQ